MVLKLKGNRCSISFHDIWDNFAFSTARRPYLCSNIPSKIYYWYYYAFEAEILRTARTKSRFGDFFKENPFKIFQAFDVTHIWQVFPAFFERFLIPSAFFVYVFLHKFTGTCFSFSLKIFSSLWTYYFLNQYSIEKRYLQYFPSCSKITRVSHIQIVWTIESIMVKNW